jgi:hypothetical protein
MPELKGFNVTGVAMVCHEANRAYCTSIGDNSQPTWADAPEWQKNSALDGVTFHLESLMQGVDPKPSASHESWLAAKKADGWIYGPIKNPYTKQHPCYVPYDKLPVSQRTKDYIFGAIVKACFQAAQDGQNV